MEVFIGPARSLPGRGAVRTNDHNIRRCRMDVSVKCMKNGPLEVSGEITITDDHGNVVKDGQKVHHLCRCGASAKKPFCDGSHSRIHFSS